MLASFLVIALVASVIGGASMAWFTAKTDLPAVEFTAGTVLVGAELKADFVGGIENVNPGDCLFVGWNITNDGTKRIQVRALNITIEVDFAWDHLFENWDALCFNTTYGEKPTEERAIEEFKALKHAKFLTDMAADLITLKTDPDYDYAWVKVGDKFYYVGACHEGIVRGGLIQFGLYFCFDGLLMDNNYQGATFTVSGRVEAVQASNDAPYNVWGDDWREAKPLPPA